MDPLILVSDNGSEYRADSFASFVGSHPELAHVLTRYCAPWTNGVVEHFNQPTKYEHLYREEVSGGDQLAVQCPSPPNPQPILRRTCCRLLDAGQPAPTFDGDYPGCYRRSPRVRRST